MILANWLKRFRRGSGFCGFSASSWDKVCNVLETIEGIGCTIHKTHSGNGWTVVVDGKSSDAPYPEGVTPSEGTGGGIPSGTELPGWVYWNETTHKVEQSTFTWDGEKFVESVERTERFGTESHSSQHT